MKNKGYSLLEVIIAVFILTVALIAIISLTMSTRIISERSSEELVAINLAREGIEVVRQIRDNNWLAIEQGQSSYSQWNDGLHDGMDYEAIAVLDTAVVGGSWSLDFVPDSLTQTSTTVYTDSSTGLYRQNSTVPAGWTATTFRRLIKVYPICDDGSHEGLTITSGSCLSLSYNQIGIDVISEVQWTNRGKMPSKILEEKLYDWK